MPPPKSAKPEKKKEIVLNRPSISNATLLIVPSDAIEGKIHPCVHHQIFDLNTISVIILDLGNSIVLIPIHTKQIIYKRQVFVLRLPYKNSK